jgi:hypothetical protein
MQKATNGREIHENEVMHVELKDMTFGKRYPGLKK